MNNEGNVRLPETETGNDVSPSAPPTPFPSSSVSSSSFPSNQDSEIRRRYYAKKNDSTNYRDSNGERNQDMQHTRTPNLHTDSLPTTTATATSSSTSTSTLKELTNVKNTSEEVHKEKEEEDQDNDSRFDCNICLDVVEDPVVTLCGHLYCWICLYRWLSTNHNICPVCKAGVTKENVIPLYVRGSDRPKHKYNDGKKSNNRNGVGSETRNINGESSSASNLNANNNTSSSTSSTQEGTEFPDRPQAQRPPIPTPSFGAGLDDVQARLNNLLFENLQNFNPFNFGQNMNQYPGENRGNGGGRPHNNNQNPNGIRRSYQFQTGFFPSMFGLQFQTYSNSNSNSTNGSNALRREEEEQQLILSRILLMVGMFLIFGLIML